jgi:uncharacterized membrane protein
MNGATTQHFHFRKCLVTALGAALVGAAGSAGAANACGCVYSVINLGPGGGVDVLNEKGQVALQSFEFDTRRFFDGERLHDIVPFRPNGYALIRDLNNLGVVVGEAEDNSEPHSELRAFTWTLAGGMRALPGSPGAGAFAVNDRNQVAGAMSEPGLSVRAVRWDPDGKVLDLGPPPFSQSIALDINKHGATAGGFDTPDRIHAAVWDAAGRQIDLGTLGGRGASARFINARGEAAGYSDNAADNGEVGFFWSARDGVVPTGAATANGTLVNALNDRGELVGETDVPGGSSPYIWSRAHGLRLLPHGVAADSRALDVNNKTRIVGVIERTLGNGHAVRWDGVSAPVDLNTLLYRPPAGLVLGGGRAINDAGDILAWSNAGMVLLRPGKRGTDAPVLGPIQGLPAFVDVGQDLRMTVGFVDNDPRQSHTATVDWTDGCTSPHPLVREAGGVGDVLLRHQFCAPGFYVVTLRVADSGGRETEIRADVVVNAPGVAAVGGRGTLRPASARAGAQTAPLQFALWAPLGKAPGDAAGGRPFVSLGGPFAFRSDRLEPPARNGSQVHLDGTGRLNGRPGYRFAIDAVVGDHMRVRIAHTGTAGEEIVDYDNGAPVAQGSFDLFDR